MTRNKSNKTMSTRGSMALTPKKLIGVVCRYYGINDVKKLASSAKLSLSLCWRHSIQEEARQVACWMLERHCDLTVEELVDALEELEWSTTYINLGVALARRKLADGDFAFRLGVENIERMLLATFAAKK